MTFSISGLHDFRSSSQHFMHILLLLVLQMMNCRVLLSKTTQDKEASTFMNTLFNGFASSVSASLSLALLSKQYELASLMVEALADESLISGMTGSVVELSQLVLLLESPAFASMRLNMIEVGKYPALLRYVRCKCEESYALHGRMYENAKPNYAILVQGYVFYIDAFASRRRIFNIIQKDLNSSPDKKQ